jgi:hypothetical protein
LLKFSAYFLNLISIKSYKYAKFQTSKTMGSSRKNKQGSIGIKINPINMLPWLDFWYWYLMVWYCWEFLHVSAVVMKLLGSLH